MAEGQPAFNENIELFKLQVLSEDERASHYTFVAAFLAVFGAFGIYLIQSQQPFVTFTVALGLGGVGLILAIIGFEAIPHRKFMERMNDYIRQVQSRERLPDFIDLYNRRRRIGNWLMSRGNRSDQSRRQRRGFGFFLLLAVTLWFTGFFAWSQTVIWQSALSDIAKSSSGSGVAVVAGEGIGETLVVSVLFAVYLWIVYRISPPIREVIDGLFGFRRGESEAPNSTT